MRERIGKTAIGVAIAILFWMSSAAEITAYPHEFARGWSKAGAEQAQS